MAQKTQNERIIAKLERDGVVTRNECLRQVSAITRLSARINDLEELGYVFMARDTGHDYVYRLVATPQAKTLAIGI